MSNDDGQVDRNSLYDLVWSQPISKLAETYGYSDVGFAKLCRKLGIPLPSRGHWARLKPGRAVKQPPLPAAKQHEQKYVCLLPLSELERLELRSRRERAATIRGSISPESVSIEAERLHPLAKAARKRLKQKDGWSDYKSLRSAPREVLDIEVTPGSIDRASIIASVLIRELEQLGAIVLIDAEKGGTSLKMRDAKIGLKISEHVVRTDHEATPAEKRALDRYRDSYRFPSGSVAYPHVPQYDFTPTGMLTITASGWPQRNWRDTKRTRLEERIGEVVSGIVALAEDVRDREIESARKAAEHSRKIECYNAQMKRRTDERQAYRGLRLDAKQWTAANQLRQYIHVIEATALQAGTLSEDKVEWVEWARQKADWLDPTILMSDLVLDAPAPTQPGYAYW